MHEMCSGCCHQNSCIEHETKLLGQNQCDREEIPMTRWLKSRSISQQASNEYNIDTRTGMREYRPGPGSKRGATCKLPSREGHGSKHRYPQHHLVWQRCKHGSLQTARSCGFGASCCSCGFRTWEAVCRIRRRRQGISCAQASPTAMSAAQQRPHGCPVAGWPVGHQGRGAGLQQGEMGGPTLSK